MKYLIKILILLLCFTGAIKADLSYEGVFELEDSEVFDDSIFQRQVAKLERFLQPYLENSNIKLDVKQFLGDRQLNASVSINQSLDSWEINYYGGLLRLPIFGPDEHMIVLCHEAGHLVGDYPFLRIGNFTSNRIYSSEGQADYFAASVCLPRIWKSEFNKNQAALINGSLEFKDHCSQRYDDLNELGMCIRILTSIKKKLSIFVQENSYLPKDNFYNPTLTVFKSYPKHPQYNCRYETYLRGVLCKSTYPVDNLPTFNNYENDHVAMKITDSYYCEDQQEAKRPSCWYHPPINSTAPKELAGLVISEEHQGAFININSQYPDDVFLLKIGKRKIFSVKAITLEGELDFVKADQYLKKAHSRFDYSIVRMAMTKKEVDELKIPTFSPTDEEIKLNQKVVVLSQSFLGKYKCEIIEFNQGEGVLSSSCLLKRNVEEGSIILNENETKIIGIVNEIEKSSFRNRTHFKAIGLKDFIQF